MLHLYYMAQIDAQEARQAVFFLQEGEGAGTRINIFVRALPVNSLGIG